MTDLTVQRDSSGTALYSIDVSSEIWTAQIPANTDTTITVPAGMTKLIMSANDDFWFSRSVITLPGGAVFSKTGFEQNPMARNVVPGETLHFLGENATRISLAFYEK